jgi:hypothetical protein
MSERRLAPPSGMPPPRTVDDPGGGGTLDLEALARAVCARYYAEFGDEDERYGEVGRAWCVHDNQHLLNWAALDVHGVVALEDQVAWLARVLEARGFPLYRLARNLELDAAVLRDELDHADAMAARLERAAAMVRERGSFL